MCPDNLKRFVANLKIGAIYVLHPESFCDKNLAIRKVFAFCDSDYGDGDDNDDGTGGTLQQGLI